MALHHERKERPRSVLRGHPRPSWGPQRTLEAGGPTPDQHCWNGNQYVWQLETAGLLSEPTPSATALAGLTQQVAINDKFAAAGTPINATMAFLQSHVEHVIYIIKENRTYDQILGDLDAGNGDRSLAMFPQPVTPNLHALAAQFVNLDAFLDTGETSGVGWNWSTAAHATDEIERNQPVNYGKGGTTYDWEGTNRNINVGLPTLLARLAADPVTPEDPDLLPGAVDVSAPDSNDSEAVGTGYLWDAVLGAGKTVRNYGAFIDLARYTADPALPSFLIPLDATPFADGMVAEVGLLPRVSIAALGQMGLGGMGPSPNAGVVAGLRVQLLPLPGAPFTWSRAGGTCARRGKDPCTTTILASGSRAHPTATTARGCRWPSRATFNAFGWRGPFMASTCSPMDATPST